MKNYSSLIICDSRYSSGKIPAYDSQRRISIKFGLSLSEVDQSVEKQPLNFDIRIESLAEAQLPYPYEEGRIISVGNSGLVIVQSRKKYIPDPMWGFHFTPEGNIIETEDINIQNAMIFPAAFYEWLQWWNNPSNFTAHRLPERPDVLSGVTHIKMHLLMERIFGNAYAGLFSADDENSMNVLYGLSMSQLSADENTLSRMREIHQYVKKQRLLVKEFNILDVLSI